ncbi:MAG TPA: hypothetical protein VFO70_07440 [Chitinophagaceae bacterium]|nr:hypothetical protein [Chitinophagaceae bacterium]
MQKESIIQFTGFITQLDFQPFLKSWETYSRQFNNMDETTLLQQDDAGKPKYKFISRQVHDQLDFSFRFMKGRTAEHFAEQKVKVVQVGGYIPLQIGCPLPAESTDSKIVAFVSHDEIDLDFFRELSNYRYLNIFQAYYESCTYGHILEFFSKPSEASELLLQLKTRPGIEAALFKECPLPFHRTVKAR